MPCFTWSGVGLPFYSHTCIYPCSLTVLFLVGCGRAVPQAMAGTRLLVPRLGVSQQSDARYETGQPTSATTTIQVLIAVLVFSYMHYIHLFTN